MPEANGLGLTERGRRFRRALHLEDGEAGRKERNGIKVHTIPYIHLVMRSFQHDRNLKVGMTCIFYSIPSEKAITISLARPFVFHLLPVCQDSEVTVLLFAFLTDVTDFLISPSPSFPQGLGTNLEDFGGLRYFKSMMCSYYNCNARPLCNFRATAYNEDMLQREKFYIQFSVSGGMRVLRGLYWHKGTIHKGRPQNFRDFGPPPPLSAFWLDL